MRSSNRKVDLYILSLAILFVFILILSAKLPEASLDYTDSRSWKHLVFSNQLPILSVFALLYCLFAYLRFAYHLKGSTELPFEITKIEDINYEHLTFLTTYIAPLISFNVGNGREVLVLCLLLVVMGIIYIKTDMFYANPSLALLGFHIYRANGSFKCGQREGIVLICRGRLNVNQKVAYIKLDDRIFFVHGSRK